MTEPDEPDQPSALAGEPQNVEQEPVLPPPPEQPPPSPAAPMPKASRPDLAAAREPVYREAGGYRLRLEVADLARLRELPGSKGKTDQELGEQFFDGQTARLLAGLHGVPSPAEVRVVVDPYSRQAFLAVGWTVQGIVSF